MSKQSEASARLRGFISPALAQTGIKLKAEKLDAITDLVGASMAGAGRYFHNPEHVIHVGSGGDGISVIAAFFHDLVYLQVDQGMGLNVARHIGPFLEEKEGALKLRADLDLAGDPVARAVLGIFGFHPGDPLPPLGGQNEFLSALTAASLLGPHATLAQIVQIAACIEATIPFRAPSRGESAAQRLFGRLSKLNKELKLGLDDAQLKGAVRRAVKMANQDVSDFGGESTAHFLKNTWELVPEINPMLRDRGNYSVDGYRRALQRMEAFFSNLDPMCIFQNFDGEPGAGVLEKLSANAKARVQEARVYFQMKLTSLAMLEALSGSLGEGLALPLLMGELANLGTLDSGVEALLPAQSQSRPTDDQETALLLLLESDTHEEHGGLKSSPLTAFLLRSIGWAELSRLWPLTEKFFEQKASARELLESFPPHAVKQVGKTISSLLENRAGKVGRFVGSITG
ncbi:hypothetical protein K2X33_14900 [bacterium]|nr:hypothetical protein [bacterium]